MEKSIYCPHCHCHTVLRVGKRQLSNGTQCDTMVQDAVGQNWWLGFCNACQGVVLVKGKGEQIFPQPLPTPTDKTIPEELRSDLDEAKLCFSVGCFRAAATMARRCLQAACITKEANADSLMKQVGELASKGIITHDLAEWATVVRWIGNDAAHPGGESVTKEDAEDCLKLIEQFLHVMFVTPAIASARRAARGK